MSTPRHAPALQPRATPVTADARLVFVLRREQPLTPGEHAVVLDVATRGRRRHWLRVEDLDVAGLDGFGDHRLVLRLRVRSPDLELTDLPRVAELLDELSAAIPASELYALDPLAVFGQHQGRVSCEGRWLLPALPPTWQEPDQARLEGPVVVDSSRTEVPPPATEAELADLLEVVDLDGASGAVMAAGATGALRHLPALREALFGGTRPGAACHVFTALAERGLADREALVEGARALASDGDGRERDAASTLLASLGATDGRPATREAPDWATVQRLGRHILDAPGLAAQADETTGSVQPTDWQDDLDLGELDDDSSDQDLLAELVDELSHQADVTAAHLLTSLPSFPARAAGRLAADDASAAGACLLLALGLWPARRIAGWYETLAGLIRSGRPWPVRALAIRALAEAGGPDATELLVTMSASDEPVLAAQAVRALARLPGARVRGAVRVAAGRSDLAASALAAMAEACDVAGFELAERALDSDDIGIRRTAAAGLDRMGGRRAVPLLERVLDQDDDASVRQAAARALARVAPGERVASLLRHRDSDLVAGALLALASAGRAELGRQVVDAGRHPDASVRRSAAQALGLLAVPATTPDLLQLLLDDDVPVGLAALDSLATAGDSRAVRMLRLLAAHPGLPGKRANAVLQTGRRLRQPAPDSQVRVLARADHLLSSRSRARIAAAFGALPLQVHVGERGLAADGDIAPQDLDSLADLVRAVAHVDAQEPGLAWSIRDAQGLVRRRDGTWRLDATSGELVRDAGWFRGDLPNVARVPLAAEVLVRPPDPGADGALPVGLSDDELADLEEDVEDEATEQTISGFLEEVTGAASKDQLDQVAAAAAPLMDDDVTRRGPPDAAHRSPPPRATPPIGLPGTHTSDGLEELLFEPDAESVPPQR